MEETKTPIQFTGIFKPKKIGDSYYLLLGTNIRDTIKIDNNTEILATLEISDTSYKCQGCGFVVKNLNKSGGVKDGRKSE